MLKYSVVLSKILFCFLLCSCRLVFANESALLSDDYVKNFLVGYSLEEQALIQDDFDNLKKLCFRGVTPVAENERTYIATAGGPGASKSTILENYLKQVKNIAYLDPDQRALRYMINTYLQEFTNLKISQKKIKTRREWDELLQKSYTKWRGASNYITFVFLNEAFKNGENIAHGTTSTGEHVENIYQKVKANGYKIILLLCYSSDENRVRALEHRYKNQSFIQVDTQDIIKKGKIFPERFPIYFKYADEIQMYWIDNFLEGASLAVTLKKGEELATHDAKALEKFTQKYNLDRKNKSLPSLDSLMKKYINNEK